MGAASFLDGHIDPTLPSLADLFVVQLLLAVPGLGRSINHVADLVDERGDRFREDSVVGCVVRKGHCPFNELQVLPVSLFLKGDVIGRFVGDVAKQFGSLFLGDLGRAELPDFLHQLQQFHAPVAEP